MDFKQSTKIEPNERYLGSIKVYLESSEDEFIIGKWFSKLKSCISFESAEKDSGKGGGGCQIVIDKAASANTESKLDAYGIVDRDTLIGNKNDLWKETDDEAFRQAQPFGPKIHVLNRWELENYLLHPTAIHHVLENKTLGKGSITQNDIVDTLLEDEDDLVTISTLDVLSVYANPPCSSPDKGFAWNESGETLKRKVKQQMQEAATEDFNNAYERISRFSEELPPGANRWDRLSRMLDGKRILMRLKKHWPEFKEPENERGALADAVMGKKLFDDDLSAFLHKVCEGAI